MHSTGIVSSSSAPLLHSWVGHSLNDAERFFNVHVDHILIICWSYVACAGLLLQSTGWLLQATAKPLCCVRLWPASPDRYGPIMDSVSMCRRYMAEINDDMDRTRATTAAKAAYEVAERNMRKGESMVKALHHQILENTWNRKGNTEFKK